MVDSKTEAIEAEMAMPNYFGKAIFYREPKSKLERAEMSRCRHAGLILSQFSRLLFSPIGKRGEERKEVSE